jgi:predicted transcriptional regulator
MTTRISAAESQIMEALWAAGSQSAGEIVAAVGPANSWGAATVKTLINRLLKKEAVVSERHAGKVRYRPLVARTDYITAESQGLLDRLFDGQLALLVAHYARRRALSPEEIAPLKRLIAELESDAG